MGVLRKLSSTGQTCSTKPEEAFNYRSKTTVAVGSGSTPVEILLNDGAPLASGDNLGRGGTIQNEGCKSLQITAVSHFVSSGGCDECIPNVLDTKNMVFIVPPGYEFDLPASGQFSSLMMVTGDEDGSGVFTASDVDAKDQVVLFLSLIHI